MTTIPNTQSDYNFETVNTIKSTNSPPLSNSPSLSTSTAPYKTKADILDNINKLLDETESQDLSTIKKRQQPHIPPPSLTRPTNPSNTYDILSLTLELQETRKTNQIMLETISKLKDQLTQSELCHKEELKKKLDEQKYEYENTIERLNDLMENLFAEKKKLNQTIEQLKDNIDDIERKYKKKLLQQEEIHNNDNQKNKNAWFQAEKLRRKKWEETKIKEIKEMTVKSLEPELDKILKDHKNELFIQEEQLNDKFRLQKEKIIAEYEDKIKRMKEAFSKEKESIQDEERKAYTKRLREQNERMEDQHLAEQKKWYQSLQDEITRLEELRKRDKLNYEKDLDLMEQRHIKDQEDKENMYKDKITQLKSNYDEMLFKNVKKEKERLQKEKERFIEDKEREYKIKYEKAKAELYDSK